MVEAEEASGSEMTAKSKCFINDFRVRASTDMIHSIRSNIKRQRTTSSVISSGRSEAGSSAIESDGEEQGDKAASKARGAARKSQREKETREKEKERAEAANKRKARIERRRVDGMRNQIVGILKS